VRRAKIDEIRPDSILARTIYYPTGIIMLKAGAKLTNPILAKLREFGHEILYIHDEDTEDIIFYDYLDEKLREKITSRIRDLYSDIKKEVQEKIDIKEFYDFSTRKMSKRLWEMEKTAKRIRFDKGFLKDIEQMIEHILSIPDLTLCVGALKTTGSYLFDHSIEVAIHSIIVARRGGFNLKEIKELTFGALLHDVGYIFVPEDIIQKANLADKEQELMKLHTFYGYHLIKSWGEMTLLGAHVAYQHHERQDGTGFPRGLKGHNRILSRKESMLDEPGFMHRYAEVVAVPNLYDSLISARPSQKGIPPDRAIREIYNLWGTGLNSQAVEIFLSYLPVYPIGAEIIVIKGKYRGYKGIVVRTYPGQLDKPIIRLLYSRLGHLKKPIQLDLREFPVDIKVIWK
jgi:HD-GYP domain-containing protein (c-di-GMP phosphodiesterase class II)